MDISIIVPIYKGTRYIESIINETEECCKNTDGIQVELILFNDFPPDRIRVDVPEKDFSIHVVNSEINHGIHGARAAALEYAAGTYVLFLDQDDYIRPEYIKSQLGCIGSSDMAVCRLLNGGKEHYTDSFRFEEVVSKEFMLNHWCSIVSPGQVLIRRESIPQVWKDNIIRANGADDYFLWLAMLGEGKKAVLNSEILFEHRVTGFNTSMNTNLMMDSEQEMIRILAGSNIFEGEDMRSLEKLGDSLRRIHIKQLDNISAAYYTRNALECIPGEKLREVLGEKIAIYGAADIGTELYRSLKKSNDFTVFFIDRNAKYVNVEVPAYILRDAPQNIDTVIIAVNVPDGSIRKELSKKYTCQILSLSELAEKVGR